MIYQIIGWVISFGLSHLLAFLVQGRQGQAFIVIDVLFTLCVALHAARPHSPVFAVLAATAVIGLNLIASFAASKIFHVDFYAAYQILELGGCIYSRNSEDGEDEEERTEPPWPQ